MQPECAQTRSAIPRSICVLSLHQAVAGKSPKICPGSGHSLSSVRHARPCRRFWNIAQTPHGSPRWPHTCGYFLKRKGGGGAPLITPLMTSCETQVHLYPLGLLSASCPVAGQVSPGYGLYPQGPQEVTAAFPGTEFRSPGDEEGSRPAPARAWQGRFTFPCAGCSGQAGILGHGSCTALGGSARGLCWGCRKLRAGQPRSAQPFCRDAMGSRAWEAIRFHGAELCGNSSVISSRWTRWSPVGFQESPAQENVPGRIPGAGRAQRFQNLLAARAVGEWRGREGVKGRPGPRGPGELSVHTRGEVGRFHSNVQGFPSVRRTEPCQRPMDMNVKGLVGAALCALFHPPSLSWRRLIGTSWSREHCMA